MQIELKVDNLSDNIGFAFMILYHGFCADTIDEVQDDEKVKALPKRFKKPFDVIKK